MITRYECDQPHIKNPKCWWFNYNSSLGAAIWMLDRDQKLKKSDVTVHKLFVWPSYNKVKNIEPNLIYEYPIILGLNNLKYHWNGQKEFLNNIILLGFSKLTDDCHLTVVIVSYAWEEVRL